jgi:tetratricopeptide (TPR) repeat protein
MKKATLALMIVLLCFIKKIEAQEQIKDVMSRADSLREAGNINGAIEEFKKAYSKNPKDESNIYNYACALSLVGQNDSCFKYLNLALQLDTTIQALIDPDLLSLRADKRWDDFETKLILMLQIKYHKTIKDLDYCKKLYEMGALDQAYYGDIDLAAKKIGPYSTVVKALGELQRRVNEQNLKELEQLIEIKGWPKLSQVGGVAATAFYIIQHSDVIKQKKYLPTLKKLCEEKEADWWCFALMYDRIQVSDKKPQKYGSQVCYNDQTKAYEIYLLEDENKVDEWRAGVGLGPLAEYVSRWGIKFEPKNKIFK